MFCIFNSENEAVTFLNYLNRQLNIQNQKYLAWVSRISSKSQNHVTKEWISYKLIDQHVKQCLKDSYCFR